ncbi:hypothetical protein QBC34DRAFT_478322 [Podospora aff. communis PSN243]|uniref:Transmembrane protein n=1 Tax=Podospora aff. communis PSN243 TaxID=3040156 RepID=A0AAV9G6N8_9PEZI|nr:hypothetical protein QBC34DRAFT_478322 [Podospora aff. communis PSN243]
MEPQHRAHEMEQKGLMSAKTNDISQQPDNPPETGSKQKTPAATKAWLILFIHAACCISLAMSMAFRLHGYKAGDESTPHRIEGKLVLRVSDITTLVSVALVIIKVIAGFWSAIVLWAFGRHMWNHKTRDEVRTRATALRMIRWKLQPGLQGLRDMPSNFAGWAISAAVVSVMIQAYIGPILTGSVNWDAGFHVSSQAVLLSSVDPTADFSQWYWYNAQGSFDKRAYLRAAAGYANLAWADTSTVDDKGKSIVGNGCRHVVSSGIGLPPNSTLIDATLPCIDIHSIQWYRSANEVTGDEWAISSGDDLILVGDDPFSYYRGGVTLVYDPTHLRQNPATTSNPPPPNKFSGTMTVALMLARRNYKIHPPCDQLPNTIFGDVRSLPYLVERTRSSSEDENCFLLGKISLSVGVTKSTRATFLSPRVIEDLTPIGDEAIWLLPDLLTMLAVSNVSQPPTFNNVDEYVKGIVRQGYLGAWDMLSHSFDMEGPEYSAFRADPRLVASVSFARAFGWLAGSLLMTVTGVIVLGVVLDASDFTPPEGYARFISRG